MTLEQAHDIKKKIMAMGEGGDEPDATGLFLPRKNSKSPKASMVQGSSILQDKASIMKAHKEASELEKRLIEDERKRAEEDLLKQGGDSAHKTILMPKYKLDERLKVDREIDPPPGNLFIGLGWDEDSTTKRKHYRMFYNDELENNTEIFPQKSPFNAYELKRGQSRGIKKGGLFSMFKSKKQDASGQVSTEQVVGFFKGIIEVESKEDKLNYKRRKDTLIDNLCQLVKEISK